MAPTELLAEQHYRSLGKILGRRYRLLLLTGSSDDAARRRQALAEGEVAIAVGTHALIQRNVGFRNLGLVIVDEQHRFGVVQRRELQLKGSRPDLLVMSATPIPRSLTLTLYGDLSVSKIDELPPGRSPVRTRVVPAANREEVYGWLEKELEAGAQAYIVLPLVEESEAVSAESIEGLGRRLADRLARFQPSVLHGRSSAEDRARIMRDFAAGRSRVLLATTLIEVGVDVPRASVMIIESAQRFGLSQLHQLRGRVGRGQAVATCVAVFAGETDEGASRLAVFARTTDGFEIAEADLALRGPGELLGTRQSGLAATGIINLVRDQEWIERARRDANELVQTDTEYSRRLASETAAVAAYDSLAGG